jgi:hypothetical protein
MGHHAKALTIAEKQAQAWAKQHERRQTAWYILSPFIVIQKWG